MRFEQTACKFEGLHLCHEFFYDLLSLFGALSVNVVKKKDQENDENGLDGHQFITIEYFNKANTYMSRARLTD